MNISNSVNLVHCHGITDSHPNIQHCVKGTPSERVGLPAELRR